MGLTPSTLSTYDYGIFSNDVFHDWNGPAPLAIPSFPSSFMAFGMLITTLNTLVSDLNFNNGTHDVARVLAFDLVDDSILRSIRYARIIQDSIKAQTSVRNLFGDREFDADWTLVLTHEVRYQTDTSLDKIQIVVTTDLTREKTYLIHNYVKRLSSSTNVTSTWQTLDRQPVDLRDFAAGGPGATNIGQPTSYIYRIDGPYPIYPVPSMKIEVADKGGEQGNGTTIWYTEGETASLVCSLDRGVTATMDCTNANTNTGLTTTTVTFVVNRPSPIECTCHTEEHQLDFYTRVYIGVIYGPTTVAIEPPETPFFHECGGNPYLQVEVTCILSGSEVNPQPPHSSISLVGQIDPTQYSRSGLFYVGDQIRYHFTISPTSDATLVVDCKAENGQNPTLTAQSSDFLEIHFLQSPSISTAPGVSVDAQTIWLQGGTTFNLTCTPQQSLADVVLDCGYDRDEASAGNPVVLPLLTNVQEPVVICECQLGQFPSSCLTWVELQIYYGPTSVTGGPAPSVWYHDCDGSYSSVNVSCILNGTNVNPEPSTSSVKLLGVTGRTSPVFADSKTRRDGEIHYHFSITPTTSSGMSLTCEATNVSAVSPINVVYMEPPTMDISTHGSVGDGEVVWVDEGSTVTATCSAGQGATPQLTCDGHIVPGSGSSRTYDVITYRNSSIPSCQCATEQFPNSCKIDFTIRIRYIPEADDISISPSTVYFSNCDGTSPTSVTLECQLPVNDVNPAPLPGSYVTLNNIGIASNSSAPLPGGFWNYVFTFTPNVPGINTTCKVVNGNLTASSISSTAIIQAVPPENRPTQMLLNDDVIIAHNDTVMLTIGAEMSVKCSQAGGVPQVANITMNCAGMAPNTSDDTTVSTTISGNRDMDQSTCVCSTEHMSGCDSLTTQFTIAVVEPQPTINVFSHGDVGNGTTIWINEGDVSQVTCTINQIVGEITLTALMECNNDTRAGAGLEASMSLTPSRHHSPMTCKCYTDKFMMQYYVEISIGIRYGPSSVTPASDEVLSFTKCDADSSPSVTMYCMLAKNDVNPQPSPSNVALQGVNGMTLTSDNVTEVGDELRYYFSFTPAAFSDVTVTCEATNVLTVQEDITITYVGPPPNPPTIHLDNGDRVENKENVTIRLGDSQIVTCAVAGGSPSVSSVTIQCAGMQGTTENGSSVSKTFVADKAIHESTCVCSGQHVTGCYFKTTNFTINVVDPARIIEYSIDSHTDTADEIHVSIGDSVTFKCHAHGMPPPAISIKGVRSEVMIDGAITTSGSDPYTKKFESTKVITGCRDSDAYRCVAANADTVQRELRLVVTCPPELDDPNTPMRPADIGNNGQFEATIDVLSHPDVHSYILEKYDRVGDGTVIKVKEFDPSEYVASISTIEGSRTRVTIRGFDRDPSEDAYYTLKMMNGVGPGLTVSFNTTIVQDKSASHKYTEEIGHEMNLYLVGIIAGVVVVVMVVMAVVYVMSFPKDTPALKQARTRSAPKNNRMVRRANPLADTRMWLPGGGHY